MDNSFWHQKWKSNDIGFHQSEANPLLVKYFSSLSLAKGKRLFLPLCGKTLDIAWLLSDGYRVAGAELSQMAVEQLFQQLEIEPVISDAGKLQRYSAKDLDIFVGDIFELSADVLGPVDAIYDRAALVALPREVRERYTMHLAQLTNKAPQLLLSYVYDQSLMSGPPFSVTDEEISQYYSHCYQLTLLASAEVPGGMKGECQATENVWLLQK